jgi:hypothetical protein
MHSSNLCVQVVDERHDARLAQQRARGEPFEPRRNKLALCITLGRGMLLQRHALQARAAGSCFAKT